VAGVSAAFLVARRRFGDETGAGCLAGPAGAADFAGPAGAASSVGSTGLADWTVGSTAVCSTAVCSAGVGET